MPTIITAHIVKVKAKSANAQARMPGATAAPISMPPIPMFDPSIFDMSIPAMSPPPLSGKAEPGMTMSVASHST